MSGTWTQSGDESDIRGIFQKKGTIREFNDITNNIRTVILSSRSGLKSGLLP